MNVETISKEDLFKERIEQSKRIEELVLEIERLNKIITELEKWLKEVSYYEEYNFVERSTFYKTLIKLNKLKGGSSNDK